jgi:hypothetical protein
LFDSFTEVAAVNPHHPVNDAAVRAASVAVEMVGPNLAGQAIFRMKWTNNEMNLALPRDLHRSRGKLNKIDSPSPFDRLGVQPRHHW